jgi:hypothetical protein
MSSTARRRRKPTRARSTTTTAKPRTRSKASTLARDHAGPVLLLQLVVVTDVRVGEACDSRPRGRECPQPQGAGASQLGLVLQQQRPSLVLAARRLRARPVLLLQLVVVTDVRVGEACDSRPRGRERERSRRLQQYVNVLNRKAQAQANSGSFYNNNGQASYSQQGVLLQLVVVTDVRVGEACDSRPRGRERERSRRCRLHRRARPSLLPAARGVPDRHDLARQLQGVAAIRQSPESPGVASTHLARRRLAASTRLGRCCCRTSPSSQASPTRTSVTTTSCKRSTGPA